MSLAASPRDGESVRRVQAALRAAGSDARIVVLSETARTAQDAARSVGCPLGAIVKSLVFRIGSQPAMALVAGDRQCVVEALPDVLGMAGETKRADAAFVREATGYAIGGVAPVGHLRPLPTAIDSSLERFETVWAAAGHPHCVFSTSVAELVRLTGGGVSKAIAR